MRRPRTTALAFSLAPPLVGAFLLLANPATAQATHSDVWAIPLTCGSHSLPSHGCMQYLVERDGKRTHFDLHPGQWCQHDIYTGPPPSSPLTGPNYNTAGRHLIRFWYDQCGPSEEEPSPTPTSTPTPTATASPTDSATPSPSTASPSPTPSAVTSTPTASEASTPSPSLTTSPSASVTPTISAGPSAPPVSPSPSGTAPTLVVPSTTPTPESPGADDASPSAAGSHRPFTSPMSKPSGSPTGAGQPSGPQVSPTVLSGAGRVPGVGSVPSRGVPQTRQSAGRTSLAHTGVYDLPRMVMAGMLLMAAGVFLAAWARRRSS